MQSYLIQKWNNPSRFVQVCAFSAKQHKCGTTFSIVMILHSAVDMKMLQKQCVHAGMCIT